MASDIPIKAPSPLNVLAGVGPPKQAVPASHEVPSQKARTVAGSHDVVGNDGRRTADQVVSSLRGLVQNLHRNLQFSIDDESGETVIKVIDSETREVVRQIPAEEIIRLRRRLEEASGVLFQGAV